MNIKSKLVPIWTGLVMLGLAILACGPLQPWSLP